MKKFVCNYPWTHFEVNNPNGDVTMCCDNSTVLGNVHEQSVAEIWNGEKYQSARRTMRDQGAHAMCPHTCPVINGYKTYQELDWYKDLDNPSDEEPSVMCANAKQNDEEFSKGQLTLESQPRWMRFCYSYKCNLDCYHCYQREDALLNDKLSKDFLKQVEELAPYYQVVFFFGGEPFLYKPMTRMMGELKTDPNTQFFFITNGTLLTDSTKEMLKERNIGLFAISLDAATSESFDELRVRGRKANWQTVMDTVDNIADLHKHRDFVFTLDMTVNSVNCHEIEQFVTLSLQKDAEPLVGLVANPDQKAEFQKEFLFFSDAQLKEMDRQITTCLRLVEQRGMKDAVAGLEHLKARLHSHRRSENSPVRYWLYHNARQLFRRLPSPIKTRVKSLVGAVSG